MLEIIANWGLGEYSYGGLLWVPLLGWLIPVLWP